MDALMQHFSSQLTLGLYLKDEATFDNFYAGKNNEILMALRKAVRRESDNLIYICGARGQGCTHLLQASCRDAYQQEITSVYLPLSHLSHFNPDILNGLESLQLVCIDDLQMIAGRAEWEEAFFHLYNRIQEVGAQLIVAAHDVPKAIAFQLPDLVSRLSGGIVYTLSPFSDEEKLSVLIMRANRRGITLSEEVGKYILRHCPRHMGTLFAALEALDNASLAAQRKLTIPFVKEVLQI